jgi:lipopolysaccharide biosynthesis regulator YciM
VTKKYIYKCEADGCSHTQEEDFWVCPSCYSDTDDVTQIEINEHKGS